MAKAATIKITIGDVAQRVANATGEGVPLVLERLRSWVRDGVLDPIPSNRQAGQHRYYGEAAIIHAAVLSLLTAHWGLWATRASSRMGEALDKAVKEAKVLDQAIKEAAKVRYATEADKEIWLFVWTTGRGEKLRVGSAIHYVDAIAPRRPKDGLPKRTVELPPYAIDAIHINLTSLFKRIGVPLAAFEEAKRLAKMFPGIENIRDWTEDLD
jgi:hypothetical protein